MSRPSRLLRILCDQHIRNLPSSLCCSCLKVLIFPFRLDMSLASGVDEGEEVACTSWARWLESEDRRYTARSRGFDVFMQCSRT